MVTYKFTLRGVDVADILSRNHASGKRVEEETTFLEYHEEGAEKRNIPLTELLSDESTRYTLFIDSNLVRTKAWVTMADQLRGPLPIRTDKPCWWCRATFDTPPLGVPIKYHSHTNSEYKKKMLEQNMNRLNIDSETNEYFETDGIMCSFPCVKAYILDNLSNPLYKNSEDLIILLYYKIYGKIIIIPVAPSWKIIDVWGGHLTTEKYRAAHCRLVYTHTPNIAHPIMYPIGRYVEEGIISVHSG